MRKNARGIGLLLELMFCLIISSILLAEAVPAWIQVRAAQQQQDALLKIRQYGNAVTAANLCAITIGCTTPASTAAIAAWPATFYPTPGSIVVEGYRWTYSPSCGNDGLGCITTTPNTTLDGRYGFFIDDTNVVRCVTPAVGISRSSPVCTF